MLHEQEGDLRARARAGVARKGLQGPDQLSVGRYGQGKSHSPSVRCRSLARDFRYGMADDAFYASKPRLEAKNALFAMAARKKAHLEATCDAGDVYMALREEGRMRGAAHGWKGDTSPRWSWRAPCRVCMRPWCSSGA